MDTKLIDLFQRARKNQTLAVIEGVQAIKHAARFQAQFSHIITSNKQQLEAFLTELAPDIKTVVLSNAVEVNEPTFNKLSPQPPRTKVIALAQRKTYKLEDTSPERQIVLLEDPRDLENIGAVIRVSAAANIGAVCITGPADVWHPAVIRGSAGLHYSVSVLNVKLNDIRLLKRPMISLNPTGEEVSLQKLPKNAILVFGTERHGISPETLSVSDQIIRLPMAPGVSSLNLATSVAATLYASM